MSCGNPQTEQDALMIRRKKFDQVRACVKCKANSGSIVVRYAVYCKECFFPLVASKFRRSLEPTINPITDGPRRRGLKASGNLLLGLSGGLGSTVLLDLVNRTYFKEPSTENGIEKPRGGKDHPRNGSVWAKTAVCYVETCSAFYGVRDKTEEIRAIVDKYDRFEFIPLRIEDAFDNAWWERMGGPPMQQEFGIDVTNEDLFLSTFATAGETDSPTSRLKTYIASLPTQTAVPSAVQTLTRLLLLHTAMVTASSHLLLGTSLTSLSISLISSISQGGGFVVREEAQEEWTPRMSMNSNATEHKAGIVRVVRPLRDTGMKECGIWAWWNGLHIVGRERFPGGRQSIGALTKDFIIGLERDYPSTVSTIARTCAKLVPKEGADSICLICERPAQYGIQDWKARISIRSFDDLSPTSYLPSHFPERVIKTSTTPDPPRSPSLTPLLCYACHTTLTSRSIRGTTTNSSMTRHQSVPLPVWTNSHFDVDEKSSSEIWARTQMKGDQMKKSIAEFLLDG